MQQREIEEVLAIWRAPAFEKARSGLHPVSVATFLQSKGLTPEVAARVAEELVEEARQKDRRRRLPQIVIGSGLVAFGICFAVYSFLNGGTILLPFGVVGFGLYIACGGFFSDLR